MKNKKIVGDYGEQLASEYLLKKGYEIIERNYQTSHQELDIIANIKDKVVFIEVKTRVLGTGFEGEDGLDKRKMDNLKRAILSYAYGNFINIDCTQLDLIVVNIDKAKKSAKIKHYLEIL